MDPPFERQYSIRVGKGAWGPTLQQTIPTPRSMHLSVQATNMSYVLSEYLGLGLMFSRGGFLTRRSQTGPSEKTLWAVPLGRYKCVQHHEGDSYTEILHRLAHRNFDAAGQPFRLRWGQTYTLAFEDPTVTGDLAHVKADVHVADGDDFEAPDSPPPYGQHGGNPVNFYEARCDLVHTKADLAAMLDMLRLGNDSEPKHTGIREIDNVYITHT